MKSSSPKTLNDTSKFLSYVLRHKPQDIGLQLDNEGWADIGALIAGTQKQGRRLTLKLIEEVVKTNDKKRFSLSADGQRIRAAQGHSTNTVQLNLAPLKPPEWLYHGTATRFLDSILAQGLLPGSRHHVHLSLDKKTAEAVGKRYGKPVVLRVAALQMHNQGFAFGQAENGVWLTEKVPTCFIAQETSPHADNP